MAARGTCCDEVAKADRLYRRTGFMGGCNAILNQGWPGILNCGLVCSLACASRCIIIIQIRFIYLKVIYPLECSVGIKNPMYRVYSGSPACETSRQLGWERVSGVL